MKLKFIEAGQKEKLNWGKFAIGRFTDEEWAVRSALPEAQGELLIRGRGWGPDHIWLLDLQTGEGAMFYPGGLASADLAKHRIWVCPMYEPLLTWLYKQDLSDLDALPAYVEIDAEFALSGYRRPGRAG